MIVTPPKIKRRKINTPKPMPSFLPIVRFLNTLNPLLVLTFNVEIQTLVAKL